ALILALAFSFLIWFLPNTKVRAPAAVLGGLVAGFLVIAAQNAYLGLSVGAARADALYGRFALIPLLFVWLYVFWAIVLFGAEVAFAYQNLDLYRREVRGQQASPAQREAIALGIALEIARAFRDHEGGGNADDLAEALTVPVRTVRDVLDRLDKAGVVAARGGDDRGEGYQLGRPAETILVTDVIAAVRGVREPIGADASIRRPVEEMLTALAEAEVQSAAGHTLADILHGVPSGASVDPPAAQG
ncbi:MAG: YhjD/YihY/BrkB family envelope integrity protein, partial [Myxococcota bacterium]